MDFPNGFVKMPFEFIRNGVMSKLGITAVGVYMILLSNMDKDTGRSAWSFTILSKYLDVDRRSIIRAVNKLKKHGLIEMLEYRNGPYGMNVYRVIHPSNIQEFKYRKQDNGISALDGNSSDNIDTTSDSNDTTGDNGDTTDSDKIVTEVVTTVSPNIEYKIEHNIEVPPNPLKGDEEQTEIFVLPESETPKKSKRTKRASSAKVKRIDKTGAYSEEFLTFWESYPKKVGKGGAWESFQKQTDNGLPEIDELVDIVEKHKQTHDWKRSAGQYIPIAQTWLNQRRWEDELETNVRSKGIVSIGGVEDMEEVR